LSQVASKLEVPAYLRETTVTVWASLPTTLCPSRRAQKFIFF
jgi:hypothetical protein